MMMNRKVLANPFVDKGSIDANQKSLVTNWTDMFKAVEPAAPGIRYRVKVDQSTVTNNVLVAFKLTNSCIYHLEVFRLLIINTIFFVLKFIVIQNNNNNFFPF
ncbi:hypothetical protein K501DRAFT_269272 [Backusella circina FSU 941]|nr:hypothetical protein K501DRAFT_269272 [Backusella circina FSU 941]